LNYAFYRFYGLHIDTAIGGESREILQGVVVIEPGFIGQGTDRGMFYANLINIVPYIIWPAASGYDLV
jgi:hypothetical protein